MDFPRFQNARRPRPAGSRGMNFPQWMKPLRAGAIIAVALLWISVPGIVYGQDAESAPASTPPELRVASWISQAHELYRSGSEGHKPSVREAEDLIDQILELAPDNAEALALKGANMTLMARDAFWPNEKVRLTRQAVKYLDQAVAIAPDNLEARWIRGSNNVHFPPFLDRLPIALDDLRLLWESSEKKPNLFPTNRKQRLGRLYGLALWKSDLKEQAEAIWTQAQNLDPNSEENLRIHETREKMNIPEPPRKIGPGRAMP